MSWSRVLLRTFTISIFIAIGGIFGNLIAAVIEHSLFSITLVNTIGALVGMFIVLGIASWIEVASKRKAARLLDEINENRENLHELRRQNVEGAVWTPKDVRRWHQHQLAIQNAKNKLESANQEVPYDIIDIYAAPKVLCIVKMM